MIKRSYAISMTYDVTDAEKQKAEKALLYFNYAIKLLNLASDHLNIMKTPFKENSETSEEEIMKIRAALRRFRDKAVSNFNDFKIESFKCVNIMQEFSSDPQIIKIMKSFISSIEKLEDNVNDFVDLFNDLSSKDFVKNIVENIELIQNKCEEIEEIIDNRIKNYIQENILSKSWVDSISNDLQLKVEKKTPLLIDLFNKRQDQLNENLKNRT
jgi:hypothetical protein